MTQPRALYLADVLQSEPDAAAAELRRLHAQRQALLEALKGILPYIAADADRDGIDFYKAELAADVAIKAAEEQT